jgi:hypothetical protein
MLNLSNAVDISFNTGPREVQKVELIFKESASDVFYIMILLQRPSNHGRIIQFRQFNLVKVK